MATRRSSGSAGGLRLHQPIVGIGAALGGYYLAASDGGVFDYAAPGAGPLFYGSTGGIRLNAPIVGDGGMTTPNAGTPVTRS